MPRKPQSTEIKAGSPDKLAKKVTEKSDVELREEDLKKVNGGLIGLLNKLN